MRGIALLALAGMLTGCAAGLRAPPVPAGLQPISAVEAARWAAVTRSPDHRILNFTWKYRNANDASNASGRGSAHIAPTDSLRFDYRGALGMGAGAAAVIGDSALWAQPEEDVRKLVPSYPLLWAMFGLARPPAGQRDLRGLETEGLTSWRYADEADTVEYVWTRSGRRVLMADVRSGGKRVGRVVTEFDATGRPVRSRLEVPSGPARLDITFTRWSTPKEFDADIWNAPDR